MLASDPAAEMTNAAPSKLIRVATSNISGTGRNSSG